MDFETVEDVDEFISDLRANMAAHVTSGSRVYITFCIKGDLASNSKPGNIRGVWSEEVNVVMVAAVPCSAPSPKNKEGYCCGKPVWVGKKIAGRSPTYCSDTCRVRAAKHKKGQEPVC